MPKTHAHSATYSFGNGLLCFLEFRSARHDFDVSAGSLPESVKQRRIRPEKALRWMHTTTCVAQKGSFQMDAKGASSQRPGGFAVAGFNGIRQVLQRTQNVFERGRDGRRI